MNASNTGPTAYHDESLGRRLRYSDLRVHNGTFRTSHDGQVIEKLDIRNGNIRISHSNVTIRAVRIISSAGEGGAYAIKWSTRDARGALIEYLEVDGKTNRNTAMALQIASNGPVTVRNCHIYGHAGGIRFGPGNTVEQCYVHSQNTWKGSHNTAISMHGGDGATVRRNNLVGSTSSALSLYANSSGIRNVLVENNLLNGGSYCTYAGGAERKPYSHLNENIRYRGNKFGRLLYPKCGEYGPVSAWSSQRGGTQWCNNTWQDTGEKVAISEVGCRN
ncbi:MAG TPA: right-handed parallel beta-helix repeat-containing protein [Nitriliruptorales bacterium]|nr:right-handed parallel beta-helix repeat-containing protein [Nitriliruptorales bacterium]